MTTTDDQLNDLSNEGKQAVKPGIDHSLRVSCSKHGRDCAATYIRGEQRYECWHCAMERFNGPGEPAKTWFDR